MKIPEALQVHDSCDIPEKRLLVAALARHIEDWLGLRRRGRLPLEGVKARRAEWILLNRFFFLEDCTDDPAPFSFLWICEHLHEDGHSLADSIRRFLLSDKAIDASVTKLHSSRHIYKGSSTF